MNIAINTRLLLKNKLEGIGWFTFETLKRITVSHPEHQFYFIFDRPYNDEFIFSKNITPIVIGPPSRHPLLWYIWFEISLARVLKKLKPDIFVSPDGYLPLSVNCKTLAVIHDIAYEHYPETVPFMARIYYKYFFPKFAKKAHRIATVSSFSKEDIIKNYNVSQDKIDVVFNGCNENFHPIDEAKKKVVREKFTENQPFFIFIGGLYPRKNIQRLIEAFEIFKEKSGLPHKFLLVGKHVFQTDLLIERAKSSKFSSDIIFTGRIDSFEELNAILSSAEAMTYVSIFEGFGIPCLEAMRCGTPVIASNTSSMPEVCGDAAILVNPYSPSKIYEAMLEVINNKTLTNKHIESGYINIKRYNWDRTATLLWDSIEKTLALNKI
jgi:glycosyltransferase involved in cell wall biosynthesis